MRLVSVEPLETVTEFAVVNSVETELGDNFEAWGGKFDFSHLNSEVRNKLIDFLKPCAHIFASNVQDLPGFDTLLHRINLTTEHPIRQHPYRVPQQLKPELNRQVNELLESGIVQESESPNLAPVLLVRKKDGTYRLCTDLRRLNEHTVPLPYPIPNITQLVDNLGGSRLFSTLDLCSGFFQMKLHLDDMWKTAFSTKNGLYEWTRVPMGPYRVLDIKTPVTYEISLLSDPSKTQVVHVQRLTHVPEQINFPSLETEVPANENGTVLSHTEEVGVERPMGFHRHRVTYHITIHRASSGQNVQSESRRPPTHSYDPRPRRAGFSYKE
ncbi:hypothetical protein JTE90_017691 [Oedothorax gibbosus]|uniref:Reverse transcriptase domain-containing protein n=1 Tax=Oedothorax gibbosus TaxID=931172 RepID=A0AAV6UZE6_9ARAC|nr:hypothetical protein JTE90_017691 [Oedothorax gibbosus]